VVALGLDGHFIKHLYNGTKGGHFEKVLIAFFKIVLEHLITIFKVKMIFLPFKNKKSKLRGS